MFLQSISKTVTKAVDASSATLAAADTGASGRHAVGIYATADVYVGGKDVTESTGIKIPAGEFKVFPVNSRNALYIVGGNCIVADFF